MIRQGNAGPVAEAVRLFLTLPPCTHQPGADKLDKVSPASVGL